jgi:transcriptional regulator of acetoin/glycerol metabolism
VDKPIASWYPGERLVLPDPRTAMIILYDVDALGHSDQLQLLEWLERGVGRTQVVSTTSAPLLPLVEAGIFSDMLYYRLNTVSVQVTA